MVGRQGAAPHFADYFFQGLPALGNVGKIECIERQSGCFELRVVARDAVLLQESASFEEFRALLTGRRRCRTLGSSVKASRQKHYGSRTSHELERCSLIAHSSFD